MTSQHWRIVAALVVLLGAGVAGFLLLSPEPAPAPSSPVDSSAIDPDSGQAHLLAAVERMESCSIAFDELDLSADNIDVVLDAARSNPVLPPPIDRMARMWASAIDEQLQVACPGAFE